MADADAIQVLDGRRAGFLLEKMAEMTLAQ